MSGVIDTKVARRTVATFFLPHKARERAGNIKRLLDKPRHHRNDEERYWLKVWKVPEWAVDATVEEGRLTASVIVHGAVQDAVHLDAPNHVVERVVEDSRKLYTLGEAAKELAVRQCAVNGHTWNIVEEEGRGPVFLTCAVCGTGLPVGMDRLPVVLAWLRDPENQKGPYEVHGYKARLADEIEERFGR